MTDVGTSSFVNLINSLKKIEKISLNFDKNNIRGLTAESISDFLKIQKETLNSV